jgi:hypothetical protein
MFNAGISVIMQVENMVVKVVPRDVSISGIEVNEIHALKRLVKLVALDVFKLPIFFNEVQP